MHRESLELMGELVAGLPRRPKRVLEVGSLNINGSYRELDVFQEAVEAVTWTGKGEPTWYWGIDVQEGPGVDQVLRKEPWGDTVGWSGSLGCPGKPDLVISGQHLEHDQSPWSTAYEMVSAVETWGFVVVIAPFVFPVHHPPDYWRFTGEGLVRLLTRPPNRSVRILASGLRGDDAFAVAEVA